ncbi:MAG TPA: regulatory protein RecX [Geobacterales bacterium]|nr:regulatory protein RecX [Geobacterales bacterium]
MPLPPSKSSDRTGDCFATALRLLARRDHTVAELEIKLARRGFTTEAITDCHNRLCQLGYLDDSRVARLMARSFQRKGMVGFRLRQELVKKGIDRPLIDTVMAELSAEYDEETAMRTLVSRRYPAFVATTAELREKKRVHDFLCRRGFSPSTISRLLKGIDGDSP